MDHQNKVQFRFKWHSEGMAEISETECKCGYKHVSPLGKDSLKVHHEDIWTCPQCQHQIQFIWQGMGWSNYVPIDEKHANIEELLYNKKAVQS